MKKRACILLVLGAILTCCKSTNDGLIDDRIVLIFDKTPSQASTDGLILGGQYTFFEPHQVIGYLDRAKRVHYFKPSPNSTDTLVIPAIHGVAEVSHLYRAYENIHYLFAAGDTVLFRYDQRDRPIVKSLTSDKLTDLYNLPFTIPGFYQNNGFSIESMLSASDFIMTYRVAKTKGFDGAPPELAQRINENYIDLDSVEVMFRNYLDDFEKKISDQKKANDLPDAWYNYYAHVIQLKRGRNVYYRERRTHSFGESGIYKDPKYQMLLNDDNLSFISSQYELYMYYLPRLYNIDTDRGIHFSALFDHTANDSNLSQLSKNIALHYYLHRIKNHSSNPNDNDRVEKYIAVTGDSSVLADAEIRRIIVENPKHDLRLKSLSGEEMDLTELLESHRGKVVYVDFWASWCVPCIQGMPAAKALREAYRNKDVVFLYLAHNDEEEKWKAAVDKYEVDYGGDNYFITNSRRSEFMEQIELESIPYYLIYDKGGNLVEIDAPRSHDPAIKALLNSYLGEN